MQISIINTSRAIAFLLLMCPFTYLNAQSSLHMKKGVIYLVRHAEKAGGNDPVLSTDGYKRSNDLQNALTAIDPGHPIEKIYVTQYRRTQLTADSVRIKQRTDTIHYLADITGDGIVAALQKLNPKKKTHILIIGHSNTIPVILKRLGINQYPDDIPDNEYDNLFKVVYKKGQPRLFIQKYGVLSEGIKK